MPPCLFLKPAFAWPSQDRRPIALADGHGLYVEVAPNGSRYWRMKYRLEGKEKRLALGVYPVVTLARARDDALEARRQLHDGIDPGQRKRERVRETQLATANAFENIAGEGHEFMQPKWTPHHARNIIEILEQDIFPSLGHRPIGEMKAPGIYPLPLPCGAISESMRGWTGLICSSSARSD